MFERIPEEMRAYRQWLVWRYEKREGAKDTKVPYSALTKRKASVTNPADWCSYEEALTALADAGPFLNGIGFVLTEADPYGFIDLDDTHGDKAAYDRQFKIFREFDSYSELSPSGSGLHIIVKGQVPHGRKRASIEVYSNERYMTMTGNVISDKPIAERHELLNVLWSEMGGPPTTYTYGQDQEQKLTDEEVITIGQRAANGDKFSQLMAGQWRELGYPSQSEADFALVDIVAYYTQNRAQIARIFRSSVLGQRDKAQSDRYIGYMLNKSFDRQLPPLDIEGLVIAFRNMASEGKAKEVYINNVPVVFDGKPVEGDGGGGQPGSEPPPPAEGSNEAQPSASPPSAASPSQSIAFPPGLVGEIAQFIQEAAPRPVPTYALAAAVGLMAGVTGRSFNISGTGLNQYVLAIGTTGTGKEAIQSGISKLMAAIKPTCPASVDFTGPGDMVSAAGLIKWLAKFPSVYALVGEVGLKLKEMSAYNANSNLVGLRRTLLDLYNKSGSGSVFNPLAYSDKEKNTAQIHSPSLTLIGESTPERFYGALDEDMIAEGLLPRFTIFEYQGPRQPLSPKADQARPSFALVEAFGSLVAQCQTLAHTSQVCNVAVDPVAYALLDQFDKWCDNQINGAQSEVTRQLWNRAHVKALKLAAVVAVGIRYMNPVVTVHEARWATDLIAGQTNELQDRFARGQIGSQNGNEAKQYDEVIRVIREYLTEPADRYSNYGVNPAMHKECVVPYGYIQKRLVSMACFRLDKQQSSAAIRRTIALMVETGILAELPKNQTQERYGRPERAFCVTAPAMFGNSGNF